MNNNIFFILQKAFPDDRASVAIETADGADVPKLYSWNDIDRGSARIANLLDSMRLPPSSRIVVQTEKSVESLILYLGIVRAGHVHVPLNTAYRAAEMEYFLADAEASAVVCPGANSEWIALLAAKAGCSEVFTLDEDGTGSLTERAAAFGVSHGIAPRSENDLATIIYTSGTTGRSKGAMLSHGNLASNAKVLNELWGWKRGDVLIHALPVFHVHGLFVAFHGALLAGCRTIWFGKFSPRAIIARLPEATVFMGVPTMYVRLLADAALTREACANIRLFIAGSAPLSPDTFAEWQTRTGHTILERYGMSETLMLASNPYVTEEGERRAGTVGFPLPGTELRITGEGGSPCPAGAIGEIEARGPNVFSGYWRMPEKTAEAFTADGWFQTGDVGKVDDLGYFTIVGRSKDLIITGGYNVYPAEIESYANEITGVAESAVVGVPHPDFGEGVVAVVVPKSGAVLDPDSIVATLKTRIAGFKVPKKVFILPELPRNAMGKVQKNILRERYGKLFAPA
ncbi:MAG: malonyl-CoA synthase [Rectinemataceae bacterium]|nr:malonyl-CoA synthase [Rectinemataceae bacterium]